MVTLAKQSYEQLVQLAHDWNVNLPIEQTSQWADFEDTIEGRSPWGAFRIDDDGEPVGLVSFIDYETHGYHYLRSHCGPVWKKSLSEDEEARLVSGIRDAVKKLDRKQAFIRMAVAHDLDITEPTLSTLPYDTTVVIDITGTTDDILARMKPRGRRDVRKALRECPAKLADETDRAAESFEEYYDVMCQTGDRDGFVPAPLSDYQSMVRVLGAEHCRVYAGRVDGKLVAWSLVTISGKRATRYYAATAVGAGRLRVADVLVLFECEHAAELGCTEYDLMGIGSEFAPETMNLNEFKTKFAKEGEIKIAPDRDVPIKRGFYGALQKVKRHRDAKHAAEESKIEVREDFLPVVLGGDVSAYALCREFHEAYGVQCVCVVPAPIALIKSSNFISVRTVKTATAEYIQPVVSELAKANSERKIILMANTDALVEEVEKCANSLPDNVICPVPPHDLMTRVSDKIEFAKLCEEYGLDAPHSEIVHLAGTDAIPPTAIPFPLIAKPAVSSGYSHLYTQGFKKVYFIKEQAELDKLWNDLRSAGFAGDFLVQELIGGDDTYVDMITIYINSRGKATFFASSQILLEDHDPTLFGNPVAMITRPKPELWKKVADMLCDLGWRGFANFDLKRDPETGRQIFMDFNPRIGRNSYYAVAGGINPMRSLVADVIDGKAGGNARVDRTALYALCPPSMLRHYVTDPELLKELDELIDAGEVYNVTRYPADSPKARMYGALMERNYVRKFKQFYPDPTDTAF